MTAPHDPEGHEPFEPFRGPRHEPPDGSPRSAGDRPVDAGTDVGADTQRFRAFADREEPPVERSGSGFRIVTLLIGLAVFAGLVWLLLR